MRNSKLFNSIGYEIYEDLLDKNDCNTLIEAAYEMKGSQSDDYSPIMHPHRQKNGEIFSKTIKKKKIFNILRSRIGKDVMLLQSEFFLCLLVQKVLHPIKMIFMLNLKTKMHL